MARCAVVAFLLIVAVANHCWALPAEDTTAHADGLAESRKIYSKQNDIKKTEQMATSSILQQLDWRTLLSTAMKMFFGNGDESSQQASRQLVNMILSLIDGLRLNFATKRSQARSSGVVEDTTTDAALAGLSMLKAYVKSITSEDEMCVKRYLCQANREAVKDGNKLGFMIAQFGSYATSYMLENFRYIPFNENIDAAKEGRSGSNCEGVFDKCNEI